MRGGATLFSCPDSSHRPSAADAPPRSGGCGARLIKLRNPWGRLEWRGDWSDASPLWTPELRGELARPAHGGGGAPAGAGRSAAGGSADDGVFWMCWDDFRDYFTAVDVCRVRPDWAEVEPHSCYTGIERWKLSESLGGAKLALPHVKGPGLTRIESSLPPS